LWLCGIFFFLPSTPAFAQSLDKPSLNIDEDVTAFGFAPDGRIAYSVRRLYHSKKYDMQRDDIWVSDARGRGKRVFSGAHFPLPAPPVVASEDDDSVTDEKGHKVKKRKEDKPEAPPFTYIVEGFRFSPNGRMVLVQLLTSRVMDETSHQQDERMTLVLDES